MKRFLMAFVIFASLPAAAFGIADELDRQIQERRALIARLKEEAEEVRKTNPAHWEMFSMRVLKIIDLEKQNLEKLKEQHDRKPSEGK